MQKTIHALESEISNLRERVAKLEAQIADPANRISENTRQAVLKFILGRIAETGGPVSIQQKEIAKAAGIHQTYVSAILKILVATNKITVTGKRAPLYSAPD